MKSEDQVCTPRQAGKLVELGLHLNTSYCWVGNILVPTSNGLIRGVFSPAPNVAELGILLATANTSIHFNIHFENMGLSYAIKICSTGSSYSDLYYTQQFTEAQARAEALIWLIENDFVKVENLKL